MSIASQTPGQALHGASAAAPSVSSTPPPPVRRRRNLTRNRWGYAYVAPFFLVFGAFSLYPFIYTA